MTYLLQRPRSLSALLLAGAAASACASIPDLGPPPQPKEASAYAARQSFAAPAVEWPQDSWWGAYGDPQLGALIGEALSGSPDLAQAQARVRHAEAFAQQAGAALRPQVGAQAAAGEVRQSYNMGIPQDFVPQGWNDAGQVGLNLSWQLDFFGKNRAVLAAATSQAEAARAEAAAARLALSTSVAGAYGDLAQLYAAHDAAVEAVRVRAASEDLIRQRVQHGLETQAALERAHAGRAAAEAGLAALEEAIGLTKNGIAVLLGQGPDRGLSIQRPAPSAMRAFGLPQNLEIDLIGRRPDVQAARLSAEAAAKRIDASRADFYEFRGAAQQLLMQMSLPAESPSGWADRYVFHQPGLETALRESIASSPNVDIRLGWTLDGFTQNPEYAVASVTTPDGPRSIRARYLVGCDGASSLVRKAIGGGLHDYQFDECWLVVDALVGPDSPLPDVAVQFCSPDRPTSCVPSGPGRHRLEFMLRPEEAPEAMLDDEVIQSLIAPWISGSVEIERKAVYRFHGLVANHWREGRVLLAGDAAHQTPPFAGQGMCAGVRDAVNLAWKLQAVISGAASPALLDTYQQERDPHVQAAIELAIGLGRVVCTMDREVAAARDLHMQAQLEAGEAPAAVPPLPPFAQGCLLADTPGGGELFPQPCCDEGGQRLRMDDLLGSDACLITRGEFGPTVRGVKVFGLQSDELAPFRAQVTAWLEAHGAEAVLVRPDRYVFGTGASATLIAAWAASLSPLKHAA